MNILIVLIILILIILIIIIRWMDERKEQEEVEALREEVFITSLIYLSLLHFFLISYLLPCYSRQTKINVHVQARKAALAKSREQERKDLNR